VHCAVFTVTDIMSLDKFRIRQVDLKLLVMFVMLKIAGESFKLALFCVCNSHLDEHYSFNIFCLVFYQELCTRAPASFA